MSQKKNEIQGVQKFFLRMSLGFVSLIVGLGIAEVSVRGVAFSKAERAAGVLALYQSQQAVDFGGYETEHPGCRWEDSLIAHPYLEFVHHSVPPCGMVDISREGFEGGRDMPRTKDPAYFTILIVGTSVAEQLSTRKSANGELILEGELNRRFVSPNGKPFRILNAAVGGTNRPDANTASLLYGDLADGIISIDGFNETNASKMGSSLMTPSNAYIHLINAPLTPGIILRSAAASTIRDFFKNTSILRSSFLAFSFQRELVGYVLRAGHPSTPVKPEENAWKFYFKQFFSQHDESPVQAQLRNRKKYEELIRANDAVARSMHVRYAHFLQPIPAFKKHLTESEKQTPFLTTQQEYQNLMDAIVDLKKERFPVFSLVNIFDDTTGPIYVDSIHCGRFGDDFPGYRIMADEIGRRLVEVWGLKKRDLQ